jgi:hypothetical protein
MLRCHLVLAIVWTAAAVGPAAGAEKQPRACTLCRGTKRAPCKFHDRRSRACRALCSACKTVPSCCKGVGWTPCKRCADDETRADYEAAAAGREKEQRGEGFYPFGEGYFLSACEHFRFKSATVTHKRLHEYHATAEKAFALFTKTFPDARDHLTGDSKAHFLILPDPDTYEKFLAWCVSRGVMTDNAVEFYKRSTTLHHRSERVHVLTDAESWGGEEDQTMRLHRIAHGAGHFALAEYEDPKQGPPWLIEGWAANAEIAALGSPRVHCVTYVGGGTGEALPPQKWRETVRGAIRRRKLPAWPRLFELDYGEMQAVEWSTAVSIVAWLLERYPKRLTALVAAIKQGKTSEEAFQDAFKADLARIQKAWRAWAIRQ